MELSSDLPLYEAIKRELQERILNGELPEGTRILPEIELAKQVGVSRSTARKALQALEMEGYLSRTAGRGSFVKTPHKKNGAGVAAGKGTLAVTVCHLERFNHAGQIVQGFMNAAVTDGYHAVIHPPYSNSSDEFEYLLNVRRSGIEGWALWLVRSTEKNVQLLRSFMKSGCALVLVDRYVRNMDCDFVVTKNEEMAYQLTRELVKRGHTEIGIINFHLDCTLTEDRLAGYMRALKEADIPFQEDLTVTDRIEGVDPLRMKLLALLGRRKRPTAIFCSTEWHAQLLLKELDGLGYRVPDDIELAIIDDNRFCETLECPAIHATQRSYEIGRQAAEILSKRLEDPGMEWQQRFLDFALNFTPSS